MIAAKYYQFIYLLIILVYTLYWASKYQNFNIKRLNSHALEPFLPTAILSIFITIFIGMRPVDNIFADMAGYASLWDLLSQREMSLHEENLIFDNLRIYMSSIGINVKMFFILIAAIYFICTSLACRKLFPHDTMLAFLVCLGAFSTFSYGTNGIKAGAAASIFLLALAYIFATCSLCAL